MKRITKKRLNEFIEKVADIKETTILNSDSKIYVSKIDGSYLTRVGMEDHLKFLLKKGITDQLQSASGKSECTTNIGFNPEEKKWYGWSHRAMYGFTIGSTCKKGHCHYRPKNKKDFKEDCIRFWDDENHLETKGRFGKNGGESGVWVNWKYNDKVRNEKLRGQIGGVFSPYPKKFGKGEWVAKTMEDAKQMAIDFAKGVS